MVKKRVGCNNNRYICCSRPWSICTYRIIDVTLHSENEQTKRSTKDNTEIRSKIVAEFNKKKYFCI